MAFCSRPYALIVVLYVTLGLSGSSALAQYAVGHRTFGGGTSFGAGYSRMDYQFPTIDPNRPFYLLPTLEFKVFFSDALSLDLSVPVVNIAASNALQDYFFFTAEAYLNFHPSAPSAVELFVAPGFGVSYAKWSTDKPEEIAIHNRGSESGYAFHIPVRLGLEFNNARRSFSLYVAARPFFSLVHGGSGETNPGGGALLEIGLMAYAVSYRTDRY
jgi:hypothetical protein